MKLKNTEIDVFDLELDIINSLASKHGLQELSRSISTSEFRDRVSEITRAARIEEMSPPDAVPSEFQRQTQSELD